MKSPQLGTVVSFYSYKGGVGRTMSVVNVAMALARNGFRVLVVDLDLLSPGVQQYPRFREAVESSTRYVPPGQRELGQGGILDLVERQLWSFVGGKENRSPFRETIRPSQENKETWEKWTSHVYGDEMSGGLIDVIPAGPADHRALGLLAQIGWYRFLKDYEGLDFMLSMRDLWWRKDYDFTLIDSRTGLSDYLQFCVGILPHTAVLIAGLNEQNMEGFRAATEGIREVLASRESDLFIIPVLSLIPAAEVDAVRERLNSAERSLDSSLKPEKWALRFITREPIKLPYLATLAVTERLIVPEDYHAPIFREYIKIAEMLSRQRFAAIDNLLNEAIYEGAAKGLTDQEVIDNLDQAREFSKNERYMYGRIRCESLNAQRWAFAGTYNESLEHFRATIKLIRERRHLKDNDRWEAADSSIGHWQIELDTLVFYARILAVVAASAEKKSLSHGSVEAAVGAFTEALDFINAFEKRNYADIFSDRDWDRYSQEILFTRAFCHLGRLEAQIMVNNGEGVIPKTVLQSHLNKTQILFDQLMPTGVSRALKDRFHRCFDAIEQIP